MLYLVKLCYKIAVFCSIEKYDYYAKLCCVNLIELARVVLIGLVKVVFLFIVKNINTLEATENFII